MVTGPATVAPEQALWDAYNSLLLGPDLARLRKLLVRARLFESTLEVPGDIIECGVFKGTGLMLFAKLLEIYAPNSRKRVLGFDIFGAFQQVVLAPEELDVAQRHDAVGEGVDIEAIRARVAAAGLSKRVELIQGDLTDTAPAYAAANYGLRISMLHLDLDTYAGTKAALEAFWPLLSPGGLVVLDEYGLTGMGESDAADEFFAKLGTRPKTVPYAETPTAYCVKP